MRLLKQFGIRYGEHTLNGLLQAAIVEGVTIFALAMNVLRFV
jgi:hypothetical protein